jgi:hypothetical protein
LNRALFSASPLERVNMPVEPNLKDMPHALANAFPANNASPSPKPPE